MEVRSGSAWQTSGGNRREYAVMLNVDDLIEQFGETKVSVMKLTEKRRRLSILADIMVVQYMREEGELTAELAAARLKDLTQRMAAVTPPPTPLEVASNGMSH